MFNVPEDNRVRAGHTMKTDPSFGNNGVFKIVYGFKRKDFIICIASDGLGWEHVSVSVKEDGKKKTPTWAQMCKVKDLFWDEEDCVVQFHPPKSEYVNNHNHCLHLWRKIDTEIETPPSLMVGVKI